MCYCDESEWEVLKDLHEGDIPDEALSSSCCWRWICRVRGFHFRRVNPEVWRETCRRRGQLCYAGWY